MNEVLKTLIWLGLGFILGRYLEQVISLGKKIKEDLERVKTK